MKTQIKFEEDEYYLVFVLGYDLLHDKLSQCDEKACDLTFDTMKEIVELFLDSVIIKDLSLSTYDALRKFLENNDLVINQILFNNLEYKGELGYEKNI